MSENEEPEEDEQDLDEDEEAENTEPTMTALIDYIARSLVENPDEVQVSEDWDGQRYVIHLDVAEGDMGKVIGRGGRVAEAMRALLKVAAARNDTRAVLDIGD
jgi:predicted RNA-binding protein YlqC (UPF0109 family)